MIDINPVSQNFNHCNTNILKSRKIQQWQLEKSGFYSSTTFSATNHTHNLPT